jgi:hypothetical protein
MKEKWEDALACATHCHTCDKHLNPQDQRILSSYTHQPICLACKTNEENKQDYQAVSKALIGTCSAETEVLYSDPQGYCYHHFYPYTCK